MLTDALGTRENENNNVISELEKEVTHLKRKNEIQTVNLVGGFECVF